jgi:glycosyltransferase involved in cell wall biosynthesis
MAHAPPLPVAFVVNNFDVGGLEKVVLSLANRLDGARVTPHVICLDGEGKLFGELTVPRERCLVLHKEPNLPLPGLRIDTRVIASIARYVRANGIRVLHAHNLAPLVYAGLAARLVRPRPRVLYSEHNQIYRATRAGRLKFRAYVYLADEILNVSRDLQTFLRDKLHLRRKMRVLYNGIDGRKYARVSSDRVRRELDVKDGEFIVGTAVVLSEQKGITHLIAAARRVLSEDPSVRFVVAGDGPLRPQLEAEAKDLGAGFRFLGYRSDIPELVSAYDLYVLSSLWEGLPLALLEALAIGKPIVATRVGGNPEIVEDGVNGYIVPPRDPDALARRILDVRRDPGMRGRVTVQNVERFHALFSVEAMLEGHAALYEEHTRD